YLKNIYVSCANILKAVQQCGSYPVNKSAPKISSYKNNREFVDLIGLDEGNSFKKFIESSKSAGHNYKSLGIFHKHYFSYKKVIKIDVFITVDIWIIMLFKGKMNI